MNRLHVISARIAARTTNISSEAAKQTQRQAILLVQDQTELLLNNATSRGWKLINGLLEIGGHIYHAVALSKNPGAWEVYKGHRDLDKSDSYVLYWWADDDLSNDNNAGTLIYEPGPNQNTDPYESWDTDQVLNDIDDINDPALKQEVTDRIKGVVSNNPPDRWDDAPRADQ